MIGIPSRLKSLATFVAALGAFGGICYSLGYIHAQTLIHDKAKTISTVERANGEAHEEQAKVEDAKIEALEARLADARAKLARIANAKRDLPTAQHEPIPAGSAIPGPGVYDLAPLAAAYEVIKLQDDEISALKAARDEWKAAATAYRRDGDALRLALASRPPARLWSAGIRYEKTASGTTEVGATLRRDIGPGFVEIAGYRDRLGFATGWRF